jgi:hypothetical protein
MATMGRQTFTTHDDEVSVADQVRGWEQDELKKMEQERQNGISTI